MSTHEKDKIVRLNSFWEPKGQTVGEAQGFCYFCIKRGKLERIRDFSLEKLASHCL